MKRIISVTLILVLITGVFVFAGCGKRDAAKQDVNGKLKIISTIFAPYDFAREVAGADGNVSMLLPPGSESHSFEPTPKDIITIQKCDVFIYVGGESDEWVKGVLSSMDTSHMKIVTLMDCVTPVEEEGTEEAPGEPEYDEHVWTSPKNAILIVKKITDSLCEASPGDANVFRQNSEAYIKKLDKLNSDFKTVVSNSSRKTLVFGDRFPFRYFADEYGLNYVAAFPGCSTETEVSAATMKSLIDKVRAEKIPVVFYIELSNQKIANTISEATGAEILLLHSCHNISKADFEAGKTYIELMNNNAKALKEALQ